VERLRAAELEVAGERVVARWDRSLYWPRQEMLVVADLHVGKTQSLRARGMTLPDGVLDDDLARAGAAVAETGARHLLILGDLIHDATGLTAGVIERLARWRERYPLPVSLVLGNHDFHVAALPPDWRVAVHERPLSVPPFSFSHEPQGGSDFNWCGHLHPVVTLRGSGDRARLPCFHVGERIGVLPAFSALTGGAEVRRGVGERVIAVVGDFVVDVSARG
jgi:DNA ligase-associated metallophosphoesterase